MFRDKDKGNQLINGIASALTIASVAFGILTSVGFGEILKNFFDLEFKYSFYLALLAAVLVSLFLIYLSRRFGNLIAQRFIYALFRMTAPARLDYVLTKKESIYTYETRTEMSFEKIYEPRVVKGSFSGIEDCYAWSGEAPLPEPSCPDPHQIYERLDNKYGPTRFKLSFKDRRTYHRGDAVPTMKLKIENIVDNGKTSSLHLSSGVYEKTDVLVLRVRFKCGIGVTDIRKLTYIHYTDHEYYSSEEGKLCCCGEYCEILWSVKKPIYGGKYVIEWNFSK